MMHTPRLAGGGTMGNIPISMTTNTEQSPTSPERTPMQSDIAALQERYRRYILDLNEGSMTSIPVDLSPLYPETNEVPELLAQVDDLKKCLDSFRPLDPAHLENIEGSLDVEYTYDSNRIEGNTLTLQETSLIVNDGVTIGGKSLIEHLEAVNHYEAIGYIRDLVRDKAPFTESILKSLHCLILRGIDRENAGRYRGLPVEIRGSRHQPPQPYAVPKLMEDHFIFYEENKDTLHPVILAAEMHERLVTIHPFIDGNGRTARLIMNLILLQHGYVIANISGEQEHRQRYYLALDQKRFTEDAAAFHRFIAGEEKTSLVQYLGLMAPDAEHGKGGYFLERIQVDSAGIGMV